MKKSAERKRLERKLKTLTENIDLLEGKKQQLEEQLEAKNKEKRQVEMVLARIP